jgi:predicted N-acyltransferase
VTDSGAAIKTSVRTVRSIRSVDPEAWDRLAGANPLLGHGWLRTMEEEWFEAVERIYFLLESGGELLGAAACCVDDTLAGAETVDDLLFGRLRSTAFGRVMSLRPALVCGFPWSMGSGCITRQDASETERDRLLGALVGAVTRESERRHCSAAFLSVTETEPQLMRQLCASGYERARHEPIHALDLRWTSFEAYRKSLPSDNMRKNIRWECNRNRREGVVVREVSAPADCAERLQEIVDRHYRRYGWPAFPYTRSWFGALKANLGSDAVIAVASREDRIVAVAVSVRKQATRQLVLACVDHDATSNDLTYFNLSYYWPIVDCIRCGDRRYVVGPGQRLARRRRGHQPVDSYVYCRPAGLIKRTVMRLWLPVLSAWLYRRAG